MRPADDDGYRLWLRYDPIVDSDRRAECRAQFRAIVAETADARLAAAVAELGAAIRGLLGTEPPVAQRLAGPGSVVLATPAADPGEVIPLVAGDLARLGPEGYAIRHGGVRGVPAIVVAANTGVGVLYGVFALIAAIQTGRALDGFEMQSAPRIAHRMLDHWDNLDGSIERGYAGKSLWEWSDLPDRVSERYRDYARANASVGINSAVLTNVNADARVLTPAYLAKVAALARVFGAYGIRVFLTARFSAPIELGDLDTADPCDERVSTWWRTRAELVYRTIPDFGGFLVKANSEGQPGPGDYGRSHADGANLLARALAPHGGIVLWRAFVYSSAVAEDRAKQAFNEFAPLDGAFDDNVVLQVKNGPIDFQPREPFHPLFGALRKTPIGVEFQLTQEYLGFASHLVYLGPLLSECLESDTFAKGPGSTVARVTDGSLDGHRSSAIAAVSNVGNARNWCGHPMAAANWFAYGRLAWDPSASVAEIAREWIQRTFGTDPELVEPVLGMLLESRETAVNTMTPLGLHHIMGYDHHYGPAPWIDHGRPDWTSVYYHRADSTGIGFDRSASGSDAVSQYAPEVARRYGQLATCPESLLLWFHHVPWTHRMSSGRILWDELCSRYQEGVEAVRKMASTWSALADRVDHARFEHVRRLLEIQEKEARWWRDACLLYFQTFSRRPLPDGVEPPELSLDEYRSIEYSGAPGI